MKKIITNIACLLVAMALFFVFAPHEANAADIQAQAAIVICFDSGDILFERDIHTPRVPASMTKAMTAFVVFEEIEAGNLTLDTLVPISANASRIAGDTTMQGAPLALTAGSYHTVDMLLHLALLPSSNGACVALAEFIAGTEAAFAQRMNESAAAIGMFSQFTNAHGAIAHYTNAYSVALLVREFITRYPDILRITGAQHVIFEGQRRNNTNQLLTVRPYAGADGFRTGTTREAGWCLASTAYRDGRRIIVVVMNAPNNDRRYGDSITLLDYGFRELARRDEALRRISVPIEFAGEELAFTAVPRIINGRAIAPARELFEALGVYSYEETADSIEVITLDGRQVYMRIGEEVMTIGGIAYSLDVAPQVISGVIFVPVRAAAYDVLGLGVSWEDGRVVIFTQN